MTDKTRKYWLSTLRGWAEDRLSPPQFAECCEVLDGMVAETERLQAHADARLRVLEAAHVVVSDKAPENIVGQWADFGPDSDALSAFVDETLDALVAEVERLRALVPEPGLLERLAEYTRAAGEDRGDEEAA